MKPKAKPRGNAIDKAVYESLAETCDELLAENAGRVGWRLQYKALGDGSRELLSVCGRFRVVVEPKPRGRCGASYRAERGVEIDDAWQWTLLSIHRTDLAAKAACQRAAVSPRARKQQTSRPTDASSPD